MLFPLTAFAQDKLEETVGTFIGRVNQVIINPLIAFMFALALVFFLVGMLQFFIHRNRNSEKANEGKQHLLWGIIGMFIMLSVFGIMQLIKGTIGSDIQI
jgi:hypothetical protein